MFWIPTKWLESETSTSEGVILPCTKRTYQFGDDDTDLEAEDIDVPKAVGSFPNFKEATNAVYEAFYVLSYHSSSCQKEKTRI